MVFFFKNGVKALWVSGGLLQEAVEKEKPVKLPAVLEMARSLAGSLKRDFFDNPL